MLVRRETAADVAAIRAVHTAAFAPGYPDGQPVEPVLVDALRRTTAWIPQLSLVAVAGGTVAGHVCTTRAYLLPGDRPVLGLGPIGVHPNHQRDGVGSALMHAAIAAADAMDEPLIVLLGHPEYYPRFGFEPAAQLGIVPPEPDWAPAFQVRRLATYDGSLTGDFRYAAPFRDLS